MAPKALRRRRRKRNELGFTLSRRGLAARFAQTPGEAAEAKRTRDLCDWSLVLEIPAANTSAPGTTSVGRSSIGWPRDWDGFPSRTNSAGLRKRRSTA